MKIFNKILQSYAIYCHKVMGKIFKCYLIPKQSYDTLSKGAIFLANLVYLQQDVQTINRNLPRDESLTPEKVCTVLFGRGRLKITMKRHTACCMCQYYTSNSCPYAAKFETAGWRSHASGLGKKKLCK